VKTVARGSYPPVTRTTRKRGQTGDLVAGAFGDGRSRGFESDFTVRAVAKRFVRRRSTAAERDRRSALGHWNRLPRGVHEVDRARHEIRTVRGDFDRYVGHRKAHRFVEARLAISPSLLVRRDRTSNGRLREIRTRVERRVGLRFRIVAACRLLERAPLASERRGNVARMNAHITRHLATIGFLMGAVSGAAVAQTDSSAPPSSAPGNLPTVPNAQRASEGGLTGGHPSLPGVNGSSPLEPYLVTWLLPGSGILVAFAVLGADRALRRRSA
jgi:hypothetical protein